MNKTYKTHPLMIFKLLKPYLFILIIPVVKVMLEFLISGEMGSFLFWEFIAAALILLIGVVRWKCYSISFKKGQLTVKRGFLLKRYAEISLDEISSIETFKNPIDRLFSAATYEVNTEAGVKGRSDFSFKLCLRDAKEISQYIYGESKNVSVKFSLIKLAVLAATTSSALTGLIISVPLLNKAGDLLGMAIGEMLFDRINKTAQEVAVYFPPIVNVVTMVFLAAYLIAFCYSLLKYINFRIKADDEKLSIAMGFFTWHKTVFYKKALNNIRIEQTPLMRFFSLYSLWASVGGFGDIRKEKATVIPCANRHKTDAFAKTFFPMLQNEGNQITAEKSARSRGRFLFKPLVFSGVVIGTMVAMVSIFTYFDRLMLFLMFVSLAVILYYANLCIYNYNNNLLQVGENTLTARGIKGFNSREIRCRKEKIGEIKFIRYPVDMKYNTCKVKITVRSESADRIKLLHLDYNTVKDEICRSFKIEE